MHAPSGEQSAIAFENQRVVVVEVGGGLRTYSIDGSDVIEGYSVDEMSTAGRGQVLIPWPNRLQDGSYEFEGRHQLPLTEPEHSNAIHGLVRWASWQVREREPHRVVLGHVVHPQPGYPFSLELTIEYELSEPSSTFARRGRSARRSSITGTRTSSARPGVLRASRSRPATAASVSRSGWTRATATSCFHRRPSRREPPWAGGRAHDVPTECLPQPRGPRHSRTARLAHRCVGSDSDDRGGRMTR
jgi:aldose 1-epimerase